MGSLPLVALVERLRYGFRAGRGRRRRMRSRRTAPGTGLRRPRPPGRALRREPDGRRTRSPRGTCRSTKPGPQRSSSGSLSSRLVATTDPAVVSTAEHVVVVIGTPVDEHLNPDPNAVSSAMADIGDHLVDGQLLVLRSTALPRDDRPGRGHGRQTSANRVDVAFCPERIAEGKAMTELFELPRSSSGRTATALDRAEKLFGTLASQMVRMQPEEAELAKLFTNTWRYIKFATANQLFMMANDFGLDYERIRQGLRARLPAGGRPAGCRVRRRTLSAEGHHAAGGLQQQQLRPRPRGDDGERGPARSTSSHDSRARTRSSEMTVGLLGHGVQGRVRRHPIEPELQAEADPALQGQRRRCATIPT